MSKQDIEEETAVQQKRDAQQKAQEYEQTLLRNFQLELGRMSGQAIVDRTAWETKEREWQLEREKYTAAIQQLNERLGALESSFPSEQGDQESEDIPEPVLKAVPEAIPPPPRPSDTKKKRQTR